MPLPTPASQAAERDISLLAIGAPCAHPSCSLVDFLPTKCLFCSAAFCAEHFRPADHPCPSYDARAADRVAPRCPVCSAPVAVPPGEDPNVRMDKHLSDVCKGAREGGRVVRTRTVPVCARPKCGKALYAPIKCSTCLREFCPSHRFPADHRCQPLSMAASPSSPTSRAKSGSPSQPQAAAHRAAANSSSHSSQSVAALSGTSSPRAPSMLPKLSGSMPQASPPLASEARVRTSSDRSVAKDTSSAPGAPPATSQTVDAHMLPPNAPASEPSTPTDAQADPDAVSHPPVSRPAPVIDPSAFIPHPIFAY